MPDPNSIRIKRSNTTTNTPLSLLNGELASNISDQKLWIGTSSNTPILLSDFTNTFVYQGDWDLGVNYKKNDVVKRNGIFYMTLHPVANNGPDPETNNEVDWQILSNPAGGGIALTDISSSAVGLNYDYTTGNFSTSEGYEIPLTSTLSSITTAYDERYHWDGGATNLVTATGRTSLGIDAVENTALSTWTGSTNITTLGAATGKSFVITDTTTGNLSSSYSTFKVSITGAKTTDLSAVTSDVHFNLARTITNVAGGLQSYYSPIGVRYTPPNYTGSSWWGSGHPITMQIDSAPTGYTGGTSTALKILTGFSRGRALVLQGATDQHLEYTNIMDVLDSNGITNFNIDPRGKTTVSGSLIVAPLANMGMMWPAESGSIKIQGKSSNSNSLGFKVPDTFSTSILLTLPSAYGTAGQVLSTNASGVLSWVTVSGGSSGATLNAVSAATATQAGIANADYGIRWNWARTTNSTSALELGETTAATAGTSTSGVPNQVGLKLSTLAASTMSPLSVYSRGSHVFSVSPTSTQILAATANDAFPAYSFANAPGCGLANPLGNILRLRADEILVENTGGAEFARFASNRFMVAIGSTSAPGLTFFSENTTGLSRPDTGAMAVSILGIENSRFLESKFQPSRSSFDTVAYAINSRKARGTVDSPLVITTGDDLLTMSGFGYVGPTNTYLEASRITFDSIGAISDTSTGIGGTIDFLTRDVGGAVTSKFTMTNKGELLVAGAAGTTGQVLTSAGSGAAPTWQTASSGGSSVTTSATAPASPTAGNQWYDTTTGIIYTYVNDGTSSQWVQGSTATLATGVPAGGTTNQFLVKSSATDYATAWTGTLLNPTFTNYTETLYDAGTGSAFTLNLSNGTIQKFTTNANMTLTLPASTAGKSFVVMVVYGGVHTLTWSSPSTLKWVGGTTPTATSVAGKIDIFSFFQDGTNTYGTVYGQNF